MKIDWTRRELAARLAPMLAGQAFAGQRAPGEAEPLETARKRLSESIRRLEEFELPMAVEPAFIFKP
jgi:hypothetical protein